jgi:UDP-N-acetylmuramate--alanine ligase
VIKKILKDYKGAKRRLEIKFNNEKYLVVDDYAHHPTEIKAALSAIRNLKFSRLIVVFQPHRYTRTKLLLDEFGRCFDSADYLIITDIYPAGEPPQEGITAGLICDKIKENSPDQKVHFLPKQEITGHILKMIKPGDLLITLGAGDITKISDELVDELKR